MNFKDQYEEEGIKPFVERSDNYEELTNELADYISSFENLDTAIGVLHDYENFVDAMDGETDVFYATACDLIKQRLVNNYDGLFDLSDVETFAVEFDINMDSLVKEMQELTGDENADAIQSDYKAFLDRVGLSP